MPHVHGCHMGNFVPFLFHKSLGSDDYRRLSAWRRRRTSTKSDHALPKPIKSTIPSRMVLKSAGTTPCWYLYGITIPASNANTPNPSKMPKNQPTMPQATLLRITTSPGLHKSFSGGW